jgi:hypothetical protein
MRARYIAAVSVALAACAVLSGCSVIPGGIVGLTVEDDRVIALVAMCPGYTTTKVELTAWEPRFSNSDDERVTWDLDETERATVDLGSVPDFRELADDRTVFVNSNTSASPFGVGGSVILDPDELDQLVDDTILVSSDDREHFATVDAAGFEAALADQCAKFTDSDG